MKLESQLLSIVNTNEQITLGRLITFYELSLCQLEQCHKHGEDVAFPNTDAFPPYTLSLLTSFVKVQRVFNPTQTSLNDLMSKYAHVWPKQKLTLNSLDSTYKIQSFYKKYRYIPYISFNCETKKQARSFLGSR